MKIIVCPKVHLNGTSGLDLLGRYTEALIRVRAALIAVENIVPHGRDYYVQDDAQHSGRSLKLATEQHQARLKALNEVHDELAAIVDDLTEQV